MVVKKRIVVVGDDTCGKTALLNVFSKGHFPENHAPTAWENYTAEIQVNDETLELVMVDTAGEEAYDRFRPLLYRDADVILICFSIDSMTTLENVTVKWKPEARHFCPDVPIILVGTKVDLRSTGSATNDPAPGSGTGVNGNGNCGTLTRTPLVTFAQGKQVAREIRAVTYLECSARTNENIRKLFEAAAKAATDSNFSPTPSPPPSSPPPMSSSRASSGPRSPLTSTRTASPAYSANSPPSYMDDDRAYLIAREDVENMGSRLGLNYNYNAQYHRNSPAYKFSLGVKFSIFVVIFLLVLLLSLVTISVLHDLRILAYPSDSSN